MKTLILCTLLCACTVWGYTQSVCTFHVDGAATPSTKTACGSFTDLKVKIPIPKNATDFDKVAATLTFSYSQLYCPYNYEGKGAVAAIAGKTVELNVLDASNKSQFYHSWEFQDGHVTKDHLCTWPREVSRLAEFTLKITVTGHNATGTERYYSEQSQSWKEKINYSAGTVLAKGEIIIGQNPLDESYTDTDKLLKINYFDPTKVFVEEYKKTIEKEYGSTNPDIHYTFFSVQAVDSLRNKDRKTTYMTLLRFDENEFTQVPAYKSVLKKVPDYTAYQFVKDMIECNFYYSLFECNTLKALKLSATKPPFSFHGFFDWKAIYGGDFENSPLSNKLLDGAKAKPAHNFWSTKKIGNTDYDYFKIDNLYYYECDYTYNKIKARKDLPPLSFDLYMAHRPPHIYLLKCIPTAGPGKYYEYYNEAEQKANFDKLINGIEFLK